jgi:Bacterial Ig-like domain (group 2)
LPSDDHFGNFLNPEWMLNSAVRSLISATLESSVNLKVNFMRNRISGFLTAVLFSGVLLSCGGGGSSDKPAPPAAPTVTSIVVAPASASQPLGLTQQFTATANLSDGTTRDVSSLAVWSSSNTSIVTVSNVGVVTTKAIGNANVRATYSNVVGSASFTVDPAAPTSIVVSTTQASRPLGLTQQFTASATFTDGVTRDVTAMASWSSSDTNVSTVGNTGLVTTKAVGASLIQATLGNVNSSATFSVTPPELISIALSIDNLRFLIGSSHPLVVTGTYTDNSAQNLSGSSTFELNESLPCEDRRTAATYSCQRRYQHHYR